MSTFGKKSLLKWDYDSVDYLRWNKTPKDLQLEILKKWYPIGEYFYYHSPFDRNKEKKGIKIKIVDYEEKIGGYFIKYISASKTLDNYVSINTCNPLRIKPSKEFLREVKLKQILKMDKKIDIKVEGTKVTASFGKTHVSINSYGDIEMNKAEAIYILNKNIRDDK
jgi:hypothetical protein